MDKEMMLQESMMDEERMFQKFKMDEEEELPVCHRTARKVNLKTKGDRIRQKKSHPADRVKRAASRYATSDSKREKLEKLWKEWENFYAGMSRDERLYLAGERKELLERVKHMLTNAKAYEMCAEDVDDVEHDGCDRALFNDDDYNDGWDDSFEYDDGGYLCDEEDDVEFDSHVCIEDITSIITNWIRRHPNPTFCEWTDMMNNMWDDYFSH